MVAGRAEQGVWVVLTMHCGCLRGVELLGAGLAAVAVNAVALIRELAQMDFLTIRAIRARCRRHLRPFQGCAEIRPGRHTAVAKHCDG